MVKTKVFVGNLSFKTKEAGLAEEFAVAGKVISANIITRGPRSLGYGFVELDSEEIAEKAVQLLNKKEIDGRMINVEVAKPRQELAEKKAPAPRNPEARNPEGRNTEGRNPEGRNPEGRNPEGRRPEGRRPEGRRPEGRNYEARNPEGRNPEGRNPEGRNAEGRNPEGRNFEARNPEGRNYEARNPEGRNYDRNPDAAPRAPRYRKPRTEEQNGTAPSRPSTGPRNPAPTKRFQPRNLNPAGSGETVKVENPKPVRVPRENQPERVPSQQTLFVANLPFSFDDVAFAKVFEDLSMKCTKAHVVKKRNGRSKGFGFVSFENEEVQKNALDAVNKKEVEGRELIVKVALTEHETPETPAPVAAEQK